MKPKSIFLTGVTGAIGRELLREFLTKTDSHLFLLVRPRKRFSHWDRVRKILAPLGLESHLGTRVQVMQGDVTIEGLGLHAYDREILLRGVDEFWHGAALTALNGSREDCSRTNVTGTENALALARDFLKGGRLQRFFYFSTAYVAGSLSRACAREEGLPEKPAHANFYESSKYEAEKRVREAHADGLPATVFRPSIVVGDSRTGEVSEFNVIYPFMKLFAHGILNKLPAKPESTFNIVPIDFVIRASLAISRQADSVGRTYHLVAKEPPTLGMLLKMREEEYPHVSPIEILDPEAFRRETLPPEEQVLYDMLVPYLGYLNGALTFDTAQTEEALRETGIEFPKTDYEFLKVLTRYAVQAGYLLI